MAKVLRTNTINDILAVYRENPLSAERFSLLYNQLRPGLGLSNKDVTDFIKTLKELSQISTPRQVKGAPERFSLGRMRAGTIMVDSAHFRKHYRGQFYVLVCVDMFNKSTYFESMRRLTAVSATRALEKIMERFMQGPIVKVFSDYGSEFAAEFDEFCSAKGIEHVRTGDSFANKSWLAGMSCTVLIVNI